MNPSKIRGITVRISKWGSTLHEFDVLPWYPGITVFDVMRIADGFANDDFTFRVVFESSHGIFVDKIWDIEDSVSDHWMLYVDGKLSDEGASETMLPAPVNDRLLVEWRYESVENYEGSRKAQRVGGSESTANLRGLNSN
jgi:hypothetical protein